MASFEDTESSFHDTVGATAQSPPYLNNVEEVISTIPWKLSERRPSCATGDDAVFLALLDETILPCHSLESFYYAVSTFLIKPEVTLKSVFCSTLSNMGPAMWTSMRDGSETCFRHPKFLDMFNQPFGCSKVDDLLRENITEVRLKRIVIIKENTTCVPFFEKWDLRRRIIESQAVLRPVVVQDVLLIEKCLPLLNFLIEYDEDTNSATVKVYGIKGRDERDGLLLLKRSLLKLANWLVTPYEIWSKDQGSIIPKMSLGSVDRLKYCSTSQALKALFYRPVAKIWKEAKETTDPNKFIPEDIYIASYLASLSSRFPHGKKFVDIGCGNGLLTFILNEIGWEGYGVDTRPRKIWSFFPNMEKRLLVKTITAKNLDELPDIDENTVVIGNHPDQLSCLIPIITRKMNAAFFILIPCCPYDVFGNKFIRNNAKVSVYEGFVQYLNDFAMGLGFVTELDRLRIPSRKKVAILGRFRRTELQHDEGLVTKLDDMMEKMKLVDAERLKRHVPLPGIVLPPNNCTRLPKEEVKKVVEQIFSFILSSGSSSVTERSYSYSWNAGARNLGLGDIIQHLGTDRLRLLKAQNKGLQTFLRNYADIFALEEGFVRLRVPNVNDILIKIRDGKGDKVKTKACFFQFKHPDGCPLMDMDCSFSHDKNLCNW